MNKERDERVVEVMTEAAKLKELLVSTINENYEEGIDYQVQLFVFCSMMVTGLRALQEYHGLTREQALRHVSLMLDESLSAYEYHKAGYNEPM